MSEFLELVAQYEYFEYMTECVCVWTTYAVGVVHECSAVSSTCHVMVEWVNEVQCMRSVVSWCMPWFSMHKDCFVLLLCSLVCDTVINKLDPAKEQIWREGMALVKKIMERTDYKVSGADGRMDKCVFIIDSCTCNLVHVL